MSLNKEKIKYFKEKLDEEKARLENDLSQVGKKNPEVTGDWEATPPDFGSEVSDTGDMASAFEEMENRSAVEDSLEERLMNVNKALQAIKDGSYGVCSVGEKKHPIELKRLEANPASTECVDHANSK